MYILDTALDETKIAVCPSASARKCGIARAGARALPDRGTRTLQPSCASTSSLAVLGTQLDLTTLSDSYARGGASGGGAARVQQLVSHFEREWDALRPANAGAVSSGLSYKC